MGMDVGGEKGGALSSPNVVPLIDILLVLLIIFMVITPLTPKGLDTLVPQPNPNQQQNQDIENKTVVVQITKDGNSKSITKIPVGTGSVRASKKSLRNARRKS